MYGNPNKISPYLPKYWWSYLSVFPTGRALTTFLLGSTFDFLLFFPLRQNWWWTIQCPYAVRWPGLPIFTVYTDVDPPPTRGPRPQGSSADWSPRGSAGGPGEWSRTGLSQERRLHWHSSDYTKMAGERRGEHCFMYMWRPSTLRQWWMAGQKILIYHPVWESSSHSERSKHQYIRIGFVSYLCIIDNVYSTVLVHSATT